MSRNRSALYRVENIRWKKELQIKYKKSRLEKSLKLYLEVLIAQWGCTIHHDIKNSIILFHIVSGSLCSFCSSLLNMQLEPTIFGVPLGSILEQNDYILMRLKPFLLVVHCYCWYGIMLHLYFSTNAHTWIKWYTPAMRCFFQGGTYLGHICGSIMI